MKKGVVSVVLPIYGVEKYLDRCMTSIVNQTYQDLEIIMVDDGSLDNCPVMCDAWAAKDKRIKVVHKKNAGLGMARNTGIENATGEYICFFDSDDYVALDTIEKAYNLAKSEASDIVLFGFSNIDSNGKRIQSTVPKSDKVTYSGSEVRDQLLPNIIAAYPGGPIQNIWMSACMCLCSMEIITASGWRFVSERDIISEDVYSLLCLYQYVNRASVLAESFYFYCENGQSLTHVYRKDRFEKICHFYEASVQKARELGYKDVVTERLQETFLSFTIAAMKQIMESDNPEKVKRHIIKDIVWNAHWQKFGWVKHRDNKKNVFCLTLRWRQPLVCYLLLRIQCARV